VIIWPPSRIGDLPIPAIFEQSGLHAAAAGAAAAPAVGGCGSAALTAGAVAWYRRRNSHAGPDNRHPGPDKRSG
jgi:hypothetical protein